MLPVDVIQLLTVQFGFVLCVMLFLCMTCVHCRCQAHFQRAFSQEFACRVCLDKSLPTECVARCPSILKRLYTGIALCIVSTFISLFVFICVLSCTSCTTWVIIIIFTWDVFTFCASIKLEFLLSNILNCCLIMLVVYRFTSLCFLCNNRCRSWLVLGWVYVSLVLSRDSQIRIVYSSMSRCMSADGYTISVCNQPPARCYYQSAGLIIAFSPPMQVNSAFHPSTVSIGERWCVTRHTARCTSTESVVWHFKLVSGWGLRKPGGRIALPCGPCSWRTCLYFT